LRLQGWLVVFVLVAAACEPARPDPRLAGWLVKHAAATAPLVRWLEQYVG
jgi:uncharacterized membrane protein YbaN (DUF454 family)